MLGFFALATAALTGLRLPYLPMFRIPVKLKKDKATSIKAG